MGNEQTEDVDDDRRELLALVGTAAAMLATGGFFLWNSLRNISPTETDPDVQESTPEPQEAREMGENITDYGAEPNPDDPDPGAARRNLVALHDAATAAGDGGTIYVPEGTYYFGYSESRIMNLFGPREPAGISIVGDGPGKSVLAVTQHMPDDQNHTAFYWWEDHDHGQVEVRDVKLDGNYENLGDLAVNGTGSRGCSIRGGANGRFTFTNVHFRGWYTSGLRHHGVSGRAHHCTFEEIGIGLHMDTAGSTVSHGATINNMDDTGEFVFDRCLFTRIAGDAVNLNSGTGTVTMRRCYGESLGNGVHKAQWGGTARHEHCYWEPHTQWLVDHFPYPADKPPFYGRNIMHRLNANDPNPTLDLNDVELRKTTFRGIGQGDEKIIIRGDNIAFHDISLGNTDGCCFTDGKSEPHSITFDLNRVSVHNTDGMIFECPNSDGVIETLVRANNHGLGDIGHITINTDDRNTEPLVPDVPTRDEVGIRVDVRAP